MESLQVLNDIFFSYCVYRIQFLRHIKEFFHLVYKIESKEEELGAVEESGCGSSEIAEDEVLSRQIVTLSCVGVGYSNFSKGIM